jgi:hypothetical protein
MPCRACWKSAVEMITASVVLASYISSLLRKGRTAPPLNFRTNSTPSSRRRLQMSETADISKFSSFACS